MKNDVTIFDGKIIISSLLKAQEALKKGVGIAKSKLEKDGAIQRFEFTYELLWKTLKKILAFKGVVSNSPREVFRAAAKNGLLEDPKFWFEVIKKRNISTHIYNEEMAEEVFDFLQLFEKELEKVIDKIRQL
ncbi:nucleotidyltransferase [bacterium]|jgi:nucleotidyltransferase substrate binding protein (TIGR01987 family)|nr:nucleotidyltransferase [bacterium]